MKNIYLLFSLVVLLTACKNQKEPETAPMTENADTLTTKYTLTPFSASQEFADASLNSIDYKAGKFIADIGGSTYKLGEQTPDVPQKMCANSAQGQHLHLIVDNGPYEAQYVPAFDYPIADGEHYVLSFLSRSYHESLKSATAYKAVKAMVKGGNFESTEPVSGPMIFYSRPKGAYTGDDKKKVMLDFYMVNATMGEYKVEADINGEKHMIDVWQPYYIEGLPDGDNTIKLSLLDKDGNLANVPLNPVSRTFKLEVTPAVN